MTLTLYNTLTRRKETFTPLEPGKVKMYCCGVTVYDYCHLGHARSYIVWDMVRRYLLWRGYQVRYVQNFTDIDDKILNKARQEGSSMEAVAEKYIQTYFEDMDRLNIMKADEYPRATHTLDGIKRLIHELEHKGFAYPAAGDVYYTVGNFSDYGKLSGRNLADMQAGASGRVEVEDPEAAKKKHPFDFALWKAAKPGEPAWESPWGAGRPGWHIECSAMVRQCLGETIDIHVGGADLVFPHHENEIAQSEAVTGKSLASYWLHNGMVNVDGEKMSKSLGNFTTIRQLLDAPNAPEPMAVRLFVMQANYRKPIDFTAEAMAAAQNSWNTLKEGLLFGYEYGKQLGWDVGQASCLSSSPVPSPQEQRFQEAMDDDFNSPGALAVLFEIAKELGKEGNILVHEGKTKTPPTQLEAQWKTLVSLANVLGLSVQPETQTNESTDGLSDAEIDDLIQQRQAARKAKNFAEGDRIRDQLKAAGITLIDTPEGTRWHRN
ncbi:cysteine--tRNA ligase [Phormidium sp. LEGE 05292]|uniref:cysteine--tRNA ligase n=1 Tax=[Phormidium] sp. LEGE 05292 TaxID=767427 RepID=UPI0018817834|nr:cysteine--tRNA ligase [Phormidium sp. LEGE 05292]MBE9228584.1 cysteine--tRNA ligase [Phormidium sp. LEGE 05292]